MSSKDSAARVLGRYVLHSELASGGMATVHLGRFKGEAGFTRTVAIKRLHPQFAKDPDFVAMFVDEARMAARIRHPNVVPTLDVITDGTRVAKDKEDGVTAEIFLVMEYVAGESLSRLLRTLRMKNQLVPPRVATTILAGVLHGLHAAHEAKSERGAPLGIVHRDVSPQNVLVGTDGIAHVLDFGVAKATGKLHTTRDGELKGKLAYMAPEQLESGTLTRQSDVYAAAVVLWETLTLKRLFEADSEGALLMQVISGKVAPPSTLVPGGLPEGLDAIVMRGLARDPAMRWETARDFALALEKCGQIAPSSEIGEWVQSIAGGVLARRAEMVSEIEGGSMSLRAAPVSDVPKGAGEAVSQVSAIAVSSSDPPEPLAPRPRGARSYVIAGGIAGLLFALLVLAFRHGPGPSAASAAPPPQVMTLPPPAARPLVATPPSTGTAVEAPAPVAVETKPTDTRPVPGWAPAPRAASPPPPPPPQRSAAKAQRADCDPPFSRDSLGHKHYKLQCL